MKHLAWGELMGLQGLRGAAHEDTEAGTAPVAGSTAVGDTAEVGIGVVHPTALPRTFDLVLPQELLIPLTLLCGWENASRNVGLRSFLLKT